jgi:hypothetical protein
MGFSQHPGGTLLAREARRITLASDERDRLHKIAHARLAPQGLAFRARLILRCAQPDKPTNLKSSSSSPPRPPRPGSPSPTGLSKIWPSRSSRTPTTGT